MKGGGWSILPALLVAGCSPPAASLPAPDAVPLASAPLPGVATLAGEWRVAGIDGRMPDQPLTIALSASATEIWWAPRCAGMVRSYRINGAAFAAGPALGTTPRKAGDPTPPVCAIGLPPHLGEAIAALDAARTVARTPANGVELSGGGRSLLLFRQ